MAAPLRGTASALLAPLEASLTRRSGTLSHPVCFVIGPPRSGTTLVYELVIHRFRLAYISNMAHRLPRTPVAATWLGRPRIRDWRGDFSSRYGHIAGPFAPSEGGAVWNRWMPQPGALDEGDVGPQACGEMRATINGVGRVLAAPFVSKNVMHSAHMRLLANVFPDAVFLRVRRRPADNARSILRAREAGGGPTGSDGWWSVKPRGWSDFASGDRVEQAAAQVVLLHRDIEANALRIGADRLLTVDYESVCADPPAALARIEAFLSGRQFGLSLRGEARIGAIVRSEAAPLDTASERRLSQLLDSLASPPLGVG